MLKLGENSNGVTSRDDGVTLRDLRVNSNSVIDLKDYARNVECHFTKEKKPDHGER